MKYILTALLSVSTLYLFGQNWTSGRPDGHAPIGVMGDHTHSKGEFMFSYRFMHMDMEGLRREGESVSSQDILNEYMITPVAMPVDMHMFGMMYAFTNKLTAMAMIHYIKKDMEHITRAGGMFSTSSSGIGDFKLTALYKIFDSNFKVNAGKAAGAIDLGNDLTDGKYSLIGLTGLMQQGSIENVFSKEIL